MSVTTMLSRPARQRVRRRPLSQDMGPTYHRRSEPTPPSMIDSHTHLDFCEPPNSELVAAAAETGVHRLLTVGTTGASCRAALEAAEDFPQVYAAIGRHPNQ